MNVPPNNSMQRTALRAAADAGRYADTVLELIGGVGGAGRTRTYHGRGALGPPAHCSR
jgi:hypothetical protein